MKFIFQLSIVILAMSLCEARICTCTAIYSPVCATNGRIYRNRCSMNCDGATFSHNGECVYYRRHSRN